MPLLDPITELLKTDHYLVGKAITDPQGVERQRGEVVVPNEEWLRLELLVARRFLHPLPFGFDLDTCVQYEVDGVERTFATEDLAIEADEHVNRTLTRNERKLGQREDDEHDGDDQADTGSPEGDANDSEPSGDEPERPAHNNLKAAWIAYVVAKGYGTEEWATDKETSKAELIAKVEEAEDTE